MKLAVVTAVALALVTAIAFAGPTRGADGERCAEPRSRTVAITRTARAYRVRGRTFACLYAVGRKLRLGDVSSEPDYFRAEEIRLAGRYVGYELAFIGRLDSHHMVRVRDLRTGRWVVHRDAIAGNIALDDRTGPGGVSDLELTRSGAVAWIAHNRYVQPHTIEVHKVDADGHAKLAFGAGIDPHSLALSGKRIYWLENGRPQTATLR